MTHGGNGVPYLNVLASLSDRLDKAATELEQVGQNPALDKDDRDAVNWIFSSLNDLCATIQGLMLADTDRSFLQMNAADTSVDQEGHAAAE